MLSLLVLSSHTTLDTAVKGFFYRLAVVHVCEKLCHPQWVTKRARLDRSCLPWTVFIELQSSTLLCLGFWLKVVLSWSSESSRCFMRRGCGGKSEASTLSSPFISEVDSEETVAGRYRYCHLISKVPLSIVEAGATAEETITLWILLLASPSPPPPPPLP